MEWFYPLQENQNRQDRWYNVTCLHPHDVLNGRGPRISQYIGNRQWRDLIYQKAGEYLKLPDNKKILMSRSIVSAVRALDPPGRFLEKHPNSSNGCWFDIGDRRATSKTSAALRDAVANYRKEQQEEYKIRCQTFSSSSGLTNQNQFLTARDGISSPRTVAISEERNHPQENTVSLQEEEPPFEAIVSSLLLPNLLQELPPPKKDANVTSTADDASVHLVSSDHFEEMMMMMDFNDVEEEERHLNHAENAICSEHRNIAPDNSDQQGNFVWTFFDDHQHAEYKEDSDFQEEMMASYHTTQPSQDRTATTLFDEDEVDLFSEPLIDFELESESMDYSWITVRTERQSYSSSLKSALLSEVS